MWRAEFGPRPWRATEPPDSDAISSMWRSPGAALQKVDRDAFRRGRTRVLQRLRGELVEVIRDNGMRRASRAERLAWERSRRGQPAL